MTAQIVLEERTDHRLEQELVSQVHAVPDLSAAESPDFQDRVFTVASRHRQAIGSISTIIETVAVVLRLGRRRCCWPLSRPRSPSRLVVFRQ
jgi:hypothetical protein